MIRKTFMIHEHTGALTECVHPDSTRQEIHEGISKWQTCLSILLGRSSFLALVLQIFVERFMEKESTLKYMTTSFQNKRLKLLFSRVTWDFYVQLLAGFVAELYMKIFQES